LLRQPPGLVLVNQPTCSTRLTQQTGGKMIQNHVLERSASKEPAVALGFWSATLATGLTIVFVLLALTVAPVQWTGIAAYARAFDSLEMGQLLPLILLAPAVVMLMAAIHHVTPERKKVFGLIAVALASTYAAIIGTNYYLQLFVVRLNLLNADLEALRLLVMPNPHSVFVALETIGYAFLSLAMLAVSPLFSGGNLENWIRRLFITSGTFGLFSAVVAPFDQPLLFYTGFGLSLLVFPGATLLVALYFRKLIRDGYPDSHQHG
jgi:hypothetical protein